MEGILYVALVICILFIIILIYLYGSQIENVRKIKEEYYNRDRKEFDSIFEKEYKEKSFQIEQLDKILHNLQSNIERTKKVNEEELERLFEEKRKNKKKELELEISEWLESAQEAAEFRAEIERKPLEDEAAAMKKSLEELKGEVEDYKARRNVINEEILRTRAIEEQQDFYRIQIPEASKEDITFLLTIVDKFNNKEIIYKLIWSEYIQKPFKSMVNRVLSNKDPKNVIYMIKNMDTNETYIGKTKAEVSKRWTEHIKTSLNIGTISRTNIHKALFNNWDKFSFTVLEEVPIDGNLNEREKYYIKFYESDIFGYNIKSGG